MTETGTRGAGVGDTLRDMWTTRPVRPREGRKIAGVGAAIARRYDIDPVLVRVALVVSLFTGVGFWLYLALALTLPGERTDGPPRWDLRPHAMVGLAGLGFLAIGSFWGGPGDGGPDGDGWDGGGWGGGAIGMTLVALGLLYLLHRSRGARPAEVAPGTPAVSLVKGAPAWDPLGAAPFAWDLPEPAPAPAPPAPKPPPVTAVTLALALLAGGATALLMLTFGALGPAWWPVLLGVVLAVLGGGLVVGSILHAGRGLIPVTVIVGLLTWGTLAGPPDWSSTNGFGDLRIDPTTPAQLRTDYRFGGRDVDMDLSDLDLAVGPDGVTVPVRTSIDIGAGDVEITVPEDADLSLVLSAGAGSVAFGDQQRDGINPRLTVTRDLGEDGVASGRPLEITVRAGAGDVEVQRD